MLSLRDCQTQFQQTLYQKDAPKPLAQAVVKNGFTPNERLQIYQNNLISTITEALHIIYPTVCKLVGNKFFEHLAHHYAKTIPSISGDPVIHGIC